MNCHRANVVVGTATYLKAGGELGLFTMRELNKGEHIFNVGYATLRTDDIIQRVYPAEDGARSRRRDYSGRVMHIHEFISAGTFPLDLNDPVAKGIQWVDLTQNKSPAIYINSHRNRANCLWGFATDHNPKRLESDGSPLLSCYATTHIPAFSELLCKYM